MGKTHHEAFGFHIKLPTTTTFLPHPLLGFSKYNPFPPLGSRGGKKNIWIAWWKTIGANDDVFVLILPLFWKLGRGGGGGGGGDSSSMHYSVFRTNILPELL